MESTQRRGEAALDGDELEQVVARRVALGVLDERGHAGEQDAEAVADGLELASPRVHATMMAGPGRTGKCRGTVPVRGPIPSIE